MIKLTNATEKFLNQPFLINPKQILTVFVAPTEDGKGITTYVYAENKETWVVKESIDEIYELIKASR